MEIQDQASCTLIRVLLTTVPYSSSDNIKILGPLPPTSQEIGSQFGFLIFALEDLGWVKRGHNGENLRLEALSRSDQANPCTLLYQVQDEILQRNKLTSNPALSLANCENVNKFLWPTVSSSIKWYNSYFIGLVRELSETLHKREIMGVLLRAQTTAPESQLPWFTSCVT